MGSGAGGGDLSWMTSTVVVATDATNGSIGFGNDGERIHVSIHACLLRNIRSTLLQKITIA